MRKQIYSTKTRIDDYFANMCNIDGTEEICGKTFEEFMKEKYNIEEDDVSDDDREKYYDEYRSVAVQECVASDSNVQSAQKIKIEDEEQHDDVLCDSSLDRYNDAMISRQESQYLEPEDVEEMKTDDRVELEIPFDAVITIDDKMGWIFDSEEWARNPDNRRGNWYGEDPEVYINDPTGIVEDVDTLLMGLIPDLPEGTKYRIKGVAYLFYDVDGIAYTVGYDGEPVYDLDRVSVRYNVPDSYIDNFTIDKVNTSTEED